MLYIVTSLPQLRLAPTRNPGQHTANDSTNENDYHSDPGAGPFSAAAAHTILYQLLNFPKLFWRYYPSINLGRSLLLFVIPQRFNHDFPNYYHRN